VLLSFSFLQYTIFGLPPTEISNGKAGKKSYKEISKRNFKGKPNGNFKGKPNGNLKGKLKGDLIGNLIGRLIEESTGCKGDGHAG